VNAKVRFHPTSLLLDSDSNGVLGVRHDKAALSRGFEARPPIHPPYPGAPMTKDFRDRGLIINQRLEEYDGITAVVST
jgi:hypothetical protein